MRGTCCLMLVILLISGCARPATKTDAGIVLKVLIWGYGATELSQLIDEYLQDRPELTIEVEVSPITPHASTHFNAYHLMIIDRIAQKNAPDIMLLRSEGFNWLASERVFYKLTPYLERTPFAYLLQDFPLTELPTSWTSDDMTTPFRQEIGRRNVRYGGEVYGLPHQAYGAIWGVWAQSPHPQEAVELLLYLAEHSREFYRASSSQIVPWLGRGPIP